MAVARMTAVHFADSSLLVSLGLIPVLLATFVDGTMIAFPSLRSLVSIRNLGPLGKPSDGEKEDPGKVSASD